MENKLFGNKSGLIGLSNLGNTCFMNSALQCLRYTIPLSAFFMRYNVQTKNELTDAYIHLVRKTWFNQSGSYSPRKFKQALGLSNKRFMGYSQQDSQEVIIHLLDVIHESLKDIGTKNKKKRSIISDIFYGKFKQIVHCPKCGYDSITYQSFTDLEIPLCKSNSSSIDLGECIENFITEETLDQNNLYTCDKCKQSVQAIKKMDLDILPNFLIVTLKRFDKQKKLNDLVDFPLEKFKIFNTEYDLYATVNHYGGRNGGHYTASVLHPNGNWYKMDDSRCSKMSPDNVIDNSVYIAFFKKHCPTIK